MRVRENDREREREVERGKLTRISDHYCQITSESFSIRFFFHKEDYKNGRLIAVERVEIMKHEKHMKKVKMKMEKRK